MLSILTQLAIFYIVINAAGFLIEKIKIPRIYSALFLGVLLGGVSIVHNFALSSSVNLLSKAGLFSLLFLLGYGLNFAQLKKQSKLIIKITSAVIFSEFIVGTLILHFLFQVPLFLSSVISISFATVGEVALLPILKEFKLLKTNLGQTILGVAILDDLAEILAFILLLSFFGHFHTNDLFYEIIPLIAIASGAICKNFIKLPKNTDAVLNFTALYIFGPFFFFTAGTEADLKVLLDKFFIILALTLIIKATKILSAYFASHKQLGTKKSIILGVSLGIKFSTSIIILIILLQKNLITSELFSILIGIKVLFKFIVPVVLSILLNKWRSDLA